MRRDEPNLFRRTLAAATWAYYSDPSAYIADARNRRLGSKLAQTILSGTRGPAQQNQQEAATLRAAQASLINFKEQSSTTPLLMKHHHCVVL